MKTKVYISIEGDRGKSRKTTTLMYITRVLELLGFVIVNDNKECKDRPNRETMKFMRISNPISFPILTIQKLAEEPKENNTVTHYGLFRPSVPESPMIKEVNFFISQEGLTMDWGKAWEPIYNATSIGDARRKFAKIKGVQLSPIYIGEK